MSRLSCWYARTFLALFALTYPGTSVSKSEEEVLEICNTFLSQNLGDPRWEQSCLDAIESWASDPRRRIDETESEALPRPTVPVNQVQSPERIAGDRDLLAARLRSGGGVDAIVEFNVHAVDTEAFERAFDEGRRALTEADLEFKRQAYAEIKERALAGLPEVEVIQDYENLPSTYVHVATEAALEELENGPDVRAVHENKVRHALLNESLPLIQQPGAAAAGFRGAGTTVAVLDTGVNYTLPPFNCTSPGVPASCRIKATFEAAPDDGPMDDVTGHGSIVSEVIHQTADQANIVVADVFFGPGTLDATILNGINWTISNQASMNIVAMNLSLGDISRNATTCGGHPLATFLANALAAGIQPIVAAGNAAFQFGVFDDGIAAPACVPAAVSVGAVYDENVGSRSWGDPITACTDSTTATDKTPCFSQTAPILSIVAPGAVITAQGSSVGGTSVAAPHVSGAWAVVKAAAPPGATKILEALQATGVSVADTRPVGGRTLSRINMLPEPGMGILVAIGALGMTGLSRVRQKDR